MTSVISVRWPDGKRLQVVAPQVVRHQVVEPVFGLVGRELLDQRQPPCVRDVRRHLAPQRAMAERCEPALQAWRTPAPASGR